MQRPTALHTSVFHSLKEQIAVIDRAGNIVDVNQAWQEFGADNKLPPEYATTNHNYLKILSDSAASGDHLAVEALQGITDVLCGTRTGFDFEYPCHSPNEKRWFIMRVTPLHGDDSRTWFVISHHNITQRKLAEEQVEKLAMQDSLTGLGNRRAFRQFLDREKRSSIRNQTQIGLILLDVDNFKKYNDKLGHIAGDQCLVSIGNILLDHARRPSDLAARLGGDEFGLVLGNTRFEVTREIAKSILKAVNDSEMYFSEAQQVTASIGMACVIPDKQDSEDFLFQEADKALYRAKAAGRNQVVYAQQLDYDGQA